MEAVALNSGFHPGYDGTKLFVEHAVSGHKINVLLCDGIGCDGFIWTYLLPDLIQFANVIHPHMRGHGQSDSPTNLEHLRMSDFAHDLESVLARLVNNEHPLIILGHSMGVQVALEFIKLYPDRCTAAVFLCGSFEHPATSFHHDDGLARALPLLKRLSRSTKSPFGFIWKTALKLPLAFTVAKLTETHPDRTERSIFEPYLAHLADMNLDVFFRTLDYANQHSARTYLPNIHMPVLVIAGEDDRMTPPRLAGELAALLPNARYLGVTDGTHIAPVEFPNAMNPVVLEFIKRESGKAKTNAPSTTAEN